MTSARPPGTWFAEPEGLQFVISGKRRSNVLIICATDVLPSVVTQVVGMCTRPIHTRKLPRDLSLPPDRSGTLLVWDVAHLTRGQQIELYDWMADHPGQPQVIAVTSIRLLPLVEDGGFFEGLFYRLNVVSLVIQARSWGSDSDAIGVSLFRPANFLPSASARSNDA